MKAVLLALGLSLVAAEAQAMSTYDPTKTQCKALKDIIWDEGAVMLRWRSPTAGVPRYGRYVRDSSFCRFGERAAGNIIPSQDKKACSVNECRPFVRGSGFN